MANIRSQEELLEEEKRLREEIEKKHGKTPEQLYEERAKRIWDTVQLKEPDRVPVVLGGTLFAARYGGLDFASAYYDPIAWKQAYIKMMMDFEPDAYGTAGVMDSGLVLEAMDPKETLWPGGPLPPDAPYQFVEMEIMKGDEYDLFLSDPSDFMLRYYLPRLYGTLAPLSKLAPLRNLAGFAGFTAILDMFTDPEFKELAEKLNKAGQEQAKWRKVMGNWREELASLGFPPAQGMGGAGGAPFEQISSRLRGMRGAMLDIYQRPEKVLAASEMIQGWNLSRAVPPDLTKRGNPRLGGGGGILRGAEGFISKKHFETFYWPFLKKALLASFDLGYVCSIFCEGRCDDRLEYFLELPKGKLVLRFAETDIFRAKDILKDHSCIMGAVPSSLLIAGSVQEVEEYCKKLIKVCGKGGGFILRATTDSIEHHKPENIKAMVDSAKKYGGY
ncbi:uroporphyrinogen decarboxylase family protein [Chloroflexota bacterium]